MSEENTSLVCCVGILAIALITMVGVACTKNIALAGAGMLAVLLIVLITFIWRLFR